MDAKVEQKKYSFKLLHEEVSNRDLLPDKTHEHAADTLYRVINDNPEKGVTIGVEGTWGSGKSTVIELLKNKIISNEKNKTLFFLFDAWAHEGDPLRRFFLESIISNIDPDAKNSELQKLLLEISQRKKTVDVKTKSGASKFGKLLSFFTLFVPAGAGLLSGIDYETVNWPVLNGNGTLHSTFFFGLIFAFAPLLFLASWPLWATKDKKTNKISWDFLEANSDETYTQDITEDGERTSIEFERFFKTILKQVIGHKKQFNRVVIVVDNLDRVEPAHALNIWSTLQTFFQHRSSGNQIDMDWAKCIWFVVPYDKEGLSKLWINNQKSDSSNNEDSLAQSFLSKCFQIKIEVPTPIMSGWVGYAESCINEAFKEWDEEERVAIQQTFQKYYSQLERSPTPREIQNIVNQIGIGCMRWGGKMFMESITLYSALRQTISERELRLILLENSLLMEYDFQNNPESIRMELAGILFGVKKVRGAELLLGPEITNALTEGNSDELKSLIITHKAGFWVAWNAIKSKVFPTPSSSPDHIINVTNAICVGMAGNKSEIQSEINELENLWTLLRNNSPLNDDDYASGLDRFLNLIGGHSILVNKWQTTISQRIPEYIRNACDVGATKPNLKQLEALGDVFAKYGVPFKTITYVDLDAERWKKWLTLLDSQNITLSFIQPAEGVLEELSNELLESNYELIDNKLALIDIAIRKFPNIDGWVFIADELIEWVNNSESELGNDHAYEVMLYIYSCINGDVAEKIRECVYEKDFWARAENEDVTTLTWLPLLVGVILSSDLQSDENVSSEVKSEWSSNDLGEETKTLYFNRLNELGQLGKLWELATDPINSTAIKIIEANSNSENLYSCAEGILKLNYYEWIESKNMPLFVERFTEAGGLRNAEKALEQNHLEYAEVFYLLLTSKKAKAVIFVKRTLINLDKAAWVEHLNSDSWLLNCVVLNEIKLNHHFSDAFVTIINDALTGVTIEDWIWDNFEALFENTIDHKNSAVLFIKSYFASKEDHLTDLIFGTVSIFLSNSVSQLNNDQVMGRLSFWLDQKQWGRISWLLDSGYETNERASDGLASRINEFQKDEKITNKHKGILESMAKTFKID